MKKISRKVFIKNSAYTMLALPFGFNSLFGESGSTYLRGKEAGILDSKNQQNDKKTSINIFSKHLQWLNYNDMALLAADLGFDGIDISVRPGGHVLPENVKVDLPACVDAIKRAGLKTDTITTGIVSVSDQYTDDILKTAAQLGIRNYRMGWCNYNSQSDIPGNIEILKKSFKSLADKNEHYHIHGDYENHTGFFGGSIWDLWLVLKDLDPKYIGCQFDIQHATVDGAEAWPTNFSLLKNHVGSITIKDFIWAKKASKWHVENVPLGQGMVDFEKYFTLLKKYNIKAPLSLHIEYPMGGAENGTSKLTIPKNEVIKNLKTDLNTLKTWLKQYELI